MQEPNTQSPVRRIIDGSWKEYLNQFSVGSSVTVLNDKLGKIARDRGQRLWGGTGRSTHYFLIDDLHQIEIDCDENDRLLSAPRYLERGIWMKSPYDTMVILENQN